MDYWALLVGLLAIKILLYSMFYPGGVNAPTPFRSLSSLVLTRFYLGLNNSSTEMIVEVFKYKYIIFTCPPFYSM